MTSRLGEFATALVLASRSSSGPAQAGQRGCQPVATVYVDGGVDVHVDLPDLKQKEGR